MKTVAFIDGQNLYLSTNFKIDFKRFRVYLKDKYKVERAYYFLGFKGDETKLYTDLQEAGFILMINDRLEGLASKKVGNVDTHLVFQCMRGFYEKEFSKVVLVSGDGDYKPMVDWLIEKQAFRALIVPSKNVSSLYRTLKVKFVDPIDNVRHKIEYKKRHP